MGNAHEAKLEAIDTYVKKLAPEQQVILILGIFIGARGRVWRDGRGYHARVYATSPQAIQPLITVLGGKYWSLAKGKVVWNLGGKVKVTWLARQVSRIVPDLSPGDLTPPKRGKKKPQVCSHCGGEDGKHCMECIDYVDSE